ncbi:ARF guanine-nucleotide exchange factor GNL1 [Nosema granulosis]|uniref:ARF guanine-nucleotide exchange factor GNL1 n=1 Tax=Nosema granulosis TaxID=83296 RepID=A0A9P6GW48_9MICR|nr:ARF guanine-nucleotide exchange factor GNL1 [Nosema granulosis]
MKDKLEEIQILLFTLPCTHNKEFVAAIKEHTADSSMLDLFDKIFSISKYTNTEMYHFLSVFSRFIEDFEYERVAKKVISLKFFPGEKDTDLVIYKYFEVVNKMRVGEEDLEDIYSRYIFLQSKEIVNNVMIHFIYEKFKEFLSTNPGFLEYTVEKGVYKEMILRNEFLMDYFDKISSRSLVDSSFESSGGMRIWIINSTRDKYLVQEFFNDIPQWYLRSLSRNLVPFLYYNFDVYGIFRELGLEYMNTLDIDNLLLEIGSSSSMSIGNINTIHNIKEAISTFNKTGDISTLVDTFGEVETMLILRSSKNTNLKILGEFLCKAKNEKYLRTFTTTFEFQDMTVVESLRVFLGGFYLVGESQVIHRVLECFTEKYFLDNVNRLVQEDEKTRKFLFNFAFSLLVLNTKMYNPNIKVKPTFKAYMEDFTPEEIPAGFSIEYLQSQFENIRESKLELAVRNKAGKYNYMVYEEICKIYKIPLKLEEVENCTIENCTVENCTIENCTIENIKHNEHEFSSSNNLKAFRDLFSKTFSNFLDSSPDKFYRLCEVLGEKKYISRYLKENKNDTSKFLGMFKYYAEMEGEEEIYRIFLQVLKRIEKPKHSVLSEIKNSLIKGQSESSSILSQYRKAYNDIVKVDFKDIQMLADSLKNTSSGFVEGLVVEILEKNLHKLRDVSMLEDGRIAQILDKAIASGNRQKFSELSRGMGRESLVGYYKNMLETVPRFLNEEICEAFKEIGIYNEDAFCIVLNIQKEFDMFDFVVNIKEEKIECRGVKIYEKNQDGVFLLDLDKGIVNDKDTLQTSVDYTDKDTLQTSIDYTDKDTLQTSEIDIIYFKVSSSKDILSCFSFEEKFREILNSPTNLFHFYASSKSILNQSKAKTIHKTGCPLSQPLFSPVEMDCRLVYMLKKADSINNKDVTNYTLWIVNLISASLPLFCRFFLDNFGLLLTTKNVNPIIKIFCSRLSKTLSGNPLCCLECGWKTYTPVENLIKMLIKYDLATVEDFSFYFDKRMEMIKNGEMKIENGELQGM